MTTINELFKPDELAAEIEGKFVHAKRHPTLPLTIYTYSRECQYEGRWNSVTTRCRGLIVDDEGIIIARPFSKFFNYGEHGARDYALPLEIEPFEVYEKMDGSLGIVFEYEDVWHVASKGSFISDQAQWAQERLRAVLWNQPIEVELQLDPTLTYCVEIIYPENRIVVDYGWREDLVFLAAFFTDGIEAPFKETAKHWNDIGSIVRSYVAPSLDDLLARAESNIGMGSAVSMVTGMDTEGFVLRFQSGTRVKVKYSEYIRLHRLLTGVTERDVWRAVAFDDLVVGGMTVEEMVRALRCSPDEIQKMIAAPGGALATIVEGCPDEFDQWVNRIVLRLRQDFNSYLIESKLAFARVREAVGLEDRGAFARKLTTDWSHNKTVVSSVFSILDNKPVAPLIWRSLYPAASTPFKEDEDS